MAGQTYDPYAVFANTAAATPDISQIPTAQLQALLDARNAATAPGSASAAAPSTGLFDDLIPNAPATSGNSLRLVPVDGDPFATGGASSSQGQPSGGNFFDRFDPPASPPQTAADGATAAPQNDPYAQFANAPSPAPAGAQPLTIQGPGNLQAAQGPIVGPTNPNAQGAPQGAPVQRTLQLIPIDGDPFAAGGAQPQQGLFDDLIPPDPGVLQHMWNAASRVPQNLSDKLSNIADGIPFSDRARAGIEAATGIGGTLGDYSGNFASTQAAAAQRMQSNPASAIMGQVLGGSMLPVGAVGDIAQGATLGAKVLRGTTQGALIGGIQGASASPNLGSLRQTAATTATGIGLGGAFGFGTPLIGAGAGSIYRKAFGQAVPAVNGPSGPIGAPAQKYLMDAIKADGPTAIKQGLTQLGPNSMLADYGNNLRGIAQGLAIKPGQAGQNVVQALEQRNAGVYPRLGQAVSQNFGPIISPMAHNAEVNNLIAPYAQAQGQAIANAGPIDVAHVYSQIQKQIENVAPGSPEHTALINAQRALTPHQPIMPSMVGRYELDPQGPLHAPQMPSDLPSAPAFAPQAAPSRPAPVGVPRPQDLHGFIKSAGGMQDPGGDLASMGLGNLIAKPGQGIGPDAMRQAAAQSGYLGANVDHAMANTDVNDLLNAVGHDSPVHSVFDQDAVHAWNERDAAMQAYQQSAGSEAAARAAGPRSAPGLAWGGPDAAPPVTIQPGVTTNARQVLSARRALDDVINYDGPAAMPSSAIRDEQGAAKTIRKGLSDALYDQVPGYSEPTAKIAELAPRRGAYDDGLTDLTRDVAHYPADYRQTFNALGPDLQDARRAGVRMNVEQLVGTNKNDLQALRNLTQGQNGWGSQNLGTVFGQRQADEVNANIAAEARMQDTHNKVTQGAETARRQAMAKALADTEHKPWQIHERPDITWEGAAYTAAVKPINAALRLFQPGIDNGARDLQLAQAVTAPGGVRNNILADLLKANTIRERNEALGAPVGAAGTALTAISPAALAAALHMHQPSKR